VVSLQSTGHLPNYEPPSSTSEVELAALELDAPKPRLSQRAEDVREALRPRS